jgi:hypothetical protein
MAEVKKMNTKKRKENNAYFVNFIRLFLIYTNILHVKRILMKDPFFFWKVGKFIHVFKTQVRKLEQLHTKGKSLSDNDFLMCTSRLSMFSPIIFHLAHLFLQEVPDSQTIKTIMSKSLLALII